MLATFVGSWHPDADAAPQAEIVRSRLSEQVSVRAAGRGSPFVSLSDGHDLVTSFEGDAELVRDLASNEARPRSLCTADFDEDGVPDLVSGYEGAGGGLLAVQRGNVDSIYPNAPEAQGRRARGEFTEAPFLSPARVFAVSESPDFVGAGDFDADGHWDVVAARRGGGTLHLLPGDGHGGFGRVRETALPGVVTALVADDVNRRDGLSDVLVGVEGPAGPQVYVFEGPAGALRSEPEVIGLRATVTSLAVGFLDEHYAADIAIAAGRELLIVRGRDRKLSLDDGFRPAIARPGVERHSFDSKLRSLAVGDFSGDARSEVAVLDEEGKVSLLGWASAGQTGDKAGRWERSSLSRGRWPGASRLVVAGGSSLPRDDLLLSDEDARRLHVVAGGAAEDGGGEAMSVASSLDIEGAPVAVQPMRLDVDGLSDLVVLRTGTSALSISLTAPGDAVVSHAATAFSNPSPITINGSNVTPYPSTINVSGLTGTVDKLRVRLSGISLNTFTSTRVLDILLVGPAGQKMILMSDVGNCCSSLTYTFDDAASSFLTDQSGSGTYKPTDVNDGSDIFQAPAPAGPYAAALSAFNGTNPNGTWSLFVRQDDSTSNMGSIAGGWALFFGPDGPPNTFVVTNTNDGGPGSLRQALLDANANFGPDLVSFNIASGPQTITPASPLPAITETVTVDATTQPGFAGRPIVEVNVSQAGDNVSAFDVRADNCVIRGFVINGMGVGSTVTGGIHLRTGEHNIVEGNFIGTDATGTLDRTDFGGMGVDIWSSNNTVGGTTPAARNLLSGADTGVNFFKFFSAPPSNNKVQGNFIGTNPEGTAPANNSTPFFGVDISQAPNNIVGGTVAGARNLISVSNSFAGVNVVNAGAAGNLIQGNFIGTDATGLSSIRNFDGVDISNGARSNTVGGSTPAARNLISGNTQGVAIGTSGLINSTPDNIIQGNFIGTDVSGVAPLTNGRAIIVPANVLGSQINANRIAFNRFEGVQIREIGTNDAPGIRVAIFENEIYANGALGIDLGPTGVTPNDAGDPDGGANLRQNFPVLTTASPASSLLAGHNEKADALGTVTVGGALNSTPNTVFTVHWYFAADQQCTNNHPTSRPLVSGRVPNVVTDGGGNASFSFPLAFPPGVASGVVNCTATDPQGNTSEFSACFNVMDTPTLQLSAPSFDASELSRSAQVTVTRTGSTAGESFVSYATSDVTATARKDYTAALGRLRFAPGETSKTLDVVITDDRFDDDGESFNVALSNPVGAALGPQTAATVSVADNDTAHGSSPVKDATLDVVFFIRQHYADFLGRAPDQAGLDFWVGSATGCGDPDLLACRINVSAAFFLSIEYQETGYLTHRAYRVAYGNLPGKPVPLTISEYLAGSRRIGEGVQVGVGNWQQQLEANKAAFFSEFVTSARFTTLYNVMTNAQFVDALNSNAGGALSPTERNTLLADLNSNAKSRAQALRAVAEDADFAQGAEKNRAFVLAQYFGYLRRDPDDTDFRGVPDPNFDGYQFWLTKLNQFNGNFVRAEMVRAFIQSIEYGERFGQ